jgi:hypothetical protein
MLILKFNSKFFNEVDFHFLSPLRKDIDLVYIAFFSALFPLSI